MTPKKTNRNASPTAFGWRFQVNAALVLFVKNIENASSLRVEEKAKTFKLRFLMVA